MPLRLHEMKTINHSGDRRGGEGRLGGGKDRHNEKRQMGGCWGQTIKEREKVKESERSGE